MFQRFGLGVHLAPVEAQHARQQQFDEPMTANDSPRLGDAALREAGAAAGFVLDPAGLGEPFQHAGDGGAHAQTGGDVGGRHLLIGAAQAVNGLEVVLFGRGRLVGHARRLKR